ncbi:MAG: UvrD-helicase domain-containing protein [Actinobacteria bacterium]|nr:UvrD-helicase domain-containing protein [Actinomycetota bacterium]
MCPATTSTAPAAPSEDGAALLAGLNPEQAAAVVHSGGPLLIVAGAGSGKTRVLTHRIAWLIRERAADPMGILAITFTNKAANEMKERVGALVGERLVGITRDAEGRMRPRRWGGMWVSTFHAACARLLRDEAPRLGYDRSFTIYDADDAARLAGLCIKDLGLDPKRVTPRGVAHAISAAKNDLVDFDTYALRADNWYERQIADVYRLYQERLHRASAFDFDDLLVKTVELLQLYDDVLAAYRERFAHVLVDEWQDTNRAQYELVRLLAREHRRLTVVGDGDQSIYRFRGADVRNILDFDKDFPDATRITLARNYRSTQTILDTANAVIAHNVGRIPKRLWTDEGAGAPVVRYTADNEHDEAAFVAEEVSRLAERDEVPSGDCAVFYRTNAQSRVLEETCIRLGVAYQIVGGTRFYERREIRDLLAYLRVLVNPADDVSAKRVLNVPRRGIGARTEEALDLFAGREGGSFLAACRRAEENHLLAPRAVGAVTDFVRLLDGLRTAVDAGELALRDIVELVWRRTGYMAELEAERTVEALGRAENLRELAGVAEDFTSLQPDATLGEFLERIALVTEQDSFDADGSRLTLMTMHNAKGLEFEVVFIVGMEDSVFPHHRSLGEPEELEEERRLCYVAMTRARRRLYLTNAWSRTLFGGTSANPPSRFLKEVPAELVEARSADHARPGPRAVGRQGADDGLGVGDRVLHPTFGPGRILEIGGRPGNEEALVRFDEYGAKRLLLAYAPMIRR